MADFTWFFERGPSPLLVSMPHVGTQLPPALTRRMTPAALTLTDTDWHLPRLYDFLPALGANLLVAVNSRYVVDLNRDPSGVPLYPGMDNSELCPLATARHEPIYLEGQEPDADEIAARTEMFWKPYHAKLEATLEEIRARFGFALLLDAHSIKSELPRFFSGTLPVINLGTAGGTSAGPGVGAALLETARGWPQYPAVLDGRFKGGHITRSYGRPGQAVHAVQLELAWRAYMDEEGSFAFMEERAARVRPALKAIVERFLSVSRAAG
jgi:N-formylglutamate deformylase